MPRFLVRCGLVVMFLLAVAAPLGVGPALAAPQGDRTFTVNAAADIAASGNLTNGVCETALHSGLCTLRAAIMKANNWHSGSVTINLPVLPANASYLLTLPPTGGDDDSSGDLNLLPSAGRPSVTIVGQGGIPVIDASGLAPRDRVLSVAPGVVATLSLLDLQNGQASMGGGLDNSGILNLEDSYIDNNRAVKVGPNPGIGGGLYNTGTVQLFNDVISNNIAAADSGGVENATGVLNSEVSLIADNSTPGHTGGIANDLGQVTLDRTSVTGNSARDGGGIANYFGVLTMTSSALVGNIATLSDGGGLVNDCSTTFLVNSTISTNYANTNGAGIKNGVAPIPCGTVLKLYSVTLANNAAATGGSGQGGGIYNLDPAVTDFENTILSNNQLGTGTFNPSDCSGALISFGYDLISSLAGCTLSGTTTGVITDTFALLRPLAFNGGFTFNHALNPNSQAIDAGNPAGCVDNRGVPLTRDQRGYPRTANFKGTDRCDMGAYELQRTLILPLVIR